MPTEVVLVPHDSTWNNQFLAESKLLLAAMGDNAIAAHHIGSTAIPAIFAKPVIDVLIVVVDIASVDGCTAEMQTIGYQVMGEFGIAGRRYFRKDDDAGTRTHQVHVYETGNAQIARHLAFRDFLLVHPDWATRYSQLKLDLATKYPHSMNRYIEGKDGFIKQVDQLAAAWRETENGNRRTSPNNITR